MIKMIEYLLRSSDFTAVIFQEFLMKIGQISANSILTLGKFTTDVEYHKDKIFAILMKPLLEICDCVVRIKNFENSDFIPIFILKNNVCEDLKIVYNEKRELFENKTIVSPETIQQYYNEIKQNNIKQIAPYIRNNLKKSNSELISEITSNLKNTSPYVRVGIKLDLFNILRILLPNFSDFFQKLIEESRIGIDNAVKQKQQSWKVLEQMFVEQKFFWDTTTNNLPKLSMFIRKLKEISVQNNNTSSEKQIIDFALNSKLFAIISVEKKQKKNEMIRDSFNTTYKIKRDINDNLVITENDKRIKIISSNKIQIIKNMIRDFVLQEIVISINPININPAERVENLLILSKKNLIEIIGKILANKNRVQLKYLLEFLKLDENEHLYAQYKKDILNIIALIENYIVKKSELGFLEEHSHSINFFLRIINNFFSQWSYKSVNKTMGSLKQKINIEIKSLYQAVKTNQNNVGMETNKEQNNYNPVKSALNFIKNNYNKIDLQNIVNSDESNIEKIKQIFSIYTEIGNTNKAIIYKNEKLQLDFIEGLKFLIKN